MAFRKQLSSFPQTKKRNCKERTAHSACRNSTSVVQNIYWHLFLSEITKRQSSEYGLMRLNPLKKINTELFWVSGTTHTKNSDLTLHPVFFFFGTTRNLQLSYSNSRTWKITNSCFLVHSCSQRCHAAYLAFLYFFFNFLNNGCIQNLQVTRWARQSRHRMCL